MGFVIRQLLLSIAMLLWGLTGYAQRNSDCSLQFAELLSKDASEITSPVSKPYSIQALWDAADARQRRLMSRAAVDGNELRKNLIPIWNDSSLPLEEKLATTFERYITERVKTLSPEKQALAKLALADIKRTKGMKSSAWNITEGKIQLGDALSEELISQYSILVHEFEHLAQYGHNPNINKTFTAWMKKYLPSSPNQVIRSEFEAIGAQWDFLQSIPLAERQRAMETVLASKKFSDIEKKVMLTDLKLSTRSREDFLRLVPKAHNYNSQTLWAVEGIKLAADTMLVVGLSYAGYKAYGAYRTINGPESGSP